MNPIAELQLAPGTALPPRAYDADQPVVLRGYVADWPAVRAGQQSAEALADYLSRYDKGELLTAYVAPAAAKGRFFYNDDFSGFNFRSGRASLAQVLALLIETQRPSEAETVYVGSTPVDGWLPGFRADNDVSIPAESVLASFWLGGQTTVSAHYDFPDNLACVVAGHRRFTLFPPDQLANLYVGPVDRTPAGQAISLVDFANPDYERFPKFAQAERHALHAELEPGDALYIPSMWWHHVRAEASLNLLVNYWWCSVPTSVGSPSGALIHAMLALRELPPRQREAWRQHFDYYVFSAGEDVTRHIPATGRGILEPFDQSVAERLKAELADRLKPSRS